MTKYINFSTGNPLLDDGLENYLMYGIEPGGFLTSVLSNDLYTAVGRADSENRQILPEIVQAIVWNMPALSHGSPGKVVDWIKDVDGRRSEYARLKEKEFTWKSLKGNDNGQKIKEPPF